MDEQLWVSLLLTNDEYGDFKIIVEGPFTESAVKAYVHKREVGGAAYHYQPLAAPFSY